MPFDANGDGRMDFLMGANGRWAIVRGSPTGLGPLARYGNRDCQRDTRDFRGADINGDGLGDIVWSEACPANDTLRVRAQLAKPTGGLAPPSRSIRNGTRSATSSRGRGLHRISRPPHRPRRRRRGRAPDERELHGRAHLGRRVSRPTGPDTFSAAASLSTSTTTAAPTSRTSTCRARRCACASAPARSMRPPRTCWGRPGRAPSSRGTRLEWRRSRRRPVARNRPTGWSPFRWATPWLRS